jgi:short-subunit dehydrogenase
LVFIQSYFSYCFSISSLALSLSPDNGYFFMKSPKSIVITGASSGLGKALALHYSAPGVTLHLHGRDAARLAATAAECKAKGASVYEHCGDVADADTMSRWLSALEPVDLVIANAGISAGTGTEGETAAQAAQIFSTNVQGVLNTIHPLLPGMIVRGRGQVGIMSSLAGIRGLPSSPAYSGSKAAVRVYGEGLRGWLSRFGVEVSVICPGYIQTPMTDVNDFPMPGLMNADKAARIIAKGLSRNRARIAFPRRLYWPLWWISCLPTSWSDPLFASLPAKPSVSDITSAKKP